MTCTSCCRAILKHIEYPVASEEDLESLVKELMFYDLARSPLYRLSMTNAFVSHVDTAPREVRNTLAESLRTSPLLAQVRTTVAIRHYLARLCVTNNSSHLISNQRNHN